MALMLSAVPHMAVLDLKVDEPTDGFVMSTFVYADVDAVSLLKAVPNIYAVGTYCKEYLMKVLSRMAFKVQSRTMQGDDPDDLLFCTLVAGYIRNIDRREESGRRRSIA